MRRLTRSAAGLVALTHDDAAALLKPHLERCTATVLAVSGGPDSVCLMRFSARSADRGSLVAATVDHGLRPESRTEAEAVAGWAAECGLPHRILTWTGPKPRTRLQEAAREARYALLAGLAREVAAGQVLTAHTLDDQAETVLMRLARGTGVGGLGGMRPRVERDGVVLGRPFLPVRKARLLAACEAGGWPFHSDPSNADPRFARTRLRRLAPLLEAEGLSPERLGALAQRAQRAEDALALRTDELIATVSVSAPAEGVVLDGGRLVAEPDALLVRVIARAIALALGGAARPIRLERFEARVLGDLRKALLEGERLRLTLAGALVEVATDGRIRIGPEPGRRRGRG